MIIFARRLALLFMLGLVAATGCSRTEDGLVGRVVRLRGPVSACGRVVEYRPGRHLILQSVAAGRRGESSLSPLSPASRIETVAVSETEYRLQRDERLATALQRFQRGEYGLALDAFLALREFDPELPCLRFFSGVCRLGRTGGATYPGQAQVLDALADFEGLSDDRVDCGSLYLGFDVHELVATRAGFGLVSFYRGLACSMAGQNENALACFRRLNRLTPEGRLLTTGELAEELANLEPRTRWRMFTEMTGLVVQAIGGMKAEKKSLQM